MVNHKQALASKLVPQWKENYIDYGLLSESLDATVKAVHKLFETQARRNQKHDKDGHLQSASSMRKRRSNNSVHVEDEIGGEDGDDGFALQKSTIVVSKIAPHKAFVEHARRELVKANTFYGSKLLELKFEFLQLLFVQLELGLVERHALVMHDRFDPGSTISIMAMQRSHAGIDVRLDEDDEDEEKDDPGDYSTEPLLGTQRNPLRPRFSAQKIVFEGSATEDSRDSTAYAGPRRAIEAWLMGSQLPHGSDYDASNDDAFQIRAAKRPREGSNMWRKHQQHRAEQVESLKLDMLEFYRELLLLQDFSDHNGTTLRKILKKHRKELGGRLERFPLLQAPLQTCPFWATELSEPSREEASLRHLISEAEALYISSFFGEANRSNTSSAAKAQRKQAMRELEVARDGGAAAWVNLFATWRLGVVVGVVAIVAVVLAFLAALPNATPASPEVLVPLYRLSGMGTLFAWVWAASFTVVLAVRVDVVKALKCNPRTMDRSSLSFFAGLCGMTVLWSITLAVAAASLKGAPLLWLSAMPSDATSYLAVYPMLLCAVGAVINVCHEVSTGGWFSLCVWATIRAPMVAVAFKDTFVADQLTSLVICLRDVFFLGCFVSLGDFTSREAVEGENACIGVTDRTAPLIAVLPAFWRLMQCLRSYSDSCPSAAGAGWWKRHWQRGQPVYLYNALKYSVAFPLAVLSFYVAHMDNVGQGQTTIREGLNVLWWFFAAVDVIYKSYWDIVHDWGLGSIDNHFLRPHVPVVASDNNSKPSEVPTTATSESSVRYRGLDATHLYPIMAYYLAVAANVTLRMSSPLLVSTGFLGVSSRTSVVACGEVFRRGLWNCFRLEKCHLAHCQEQCVRQTQRLEHFHRLVSKGAKGKKYGHLARGHEQQSSSPRGASGGAKCSGPALGMMPHTVPPELVSNPRNDGALEGHALHSASDNIAMISSSGGDGVELCDINRMDGGSFVQAAHDDEAPCGGVHSNLDGEGGGVHLSDEGGAEVRLGVSFFNEEEEEEEDEGGGLALRRNISTCEAAPEGTPTAEPSFLSDEWLQSKLLEIQRGSSLDIAS